MAEDTKNDRIIEAIFDVLPATDYEEISAKVSRKLREPISVGSIAMALAHLRRNCAEYGWTVPHVKRGPAIELDENRFFALLVDRDGHYELDSNPDAKMHLQNGSFSTMQHAATMMSNHAEALKIAATHTRSINSRAKINDLADDFGYISRKAAAVVRELKLAKLA